ncbi:MAG: hypothetical protein LWY06_13655 [Firmicutes bacterium]|nr:hypothetical protein [Bacillota bacterium]
MESRNVMKKIALSLVFFVLICNAAFAGIEDDKYYSDRFIFLGWLYNKPLIATIAFNRGYSESGKFKYGAEFEGYVLFADKWHNLKNGNYIEQDTPINLEEIPAFQPCIFAWKDKFESGAVNYDLQEISFLLQFRNMKLIDESGRMPDFIQKTAVADAMMQFQGNQVPGRLFYQSMNFRGYNRLSHNFNHLDRKKFEQFFLLGQDGNMFVIWEEHEGNKTKDRLIDDRKIIYLDENANIFPIEGNPDVKWTETAKENDPSAPFRHYPTAWEIRTGVTGDKIDLFRTSGFYWFSRGMTGLRGVYKGRLFMGLHEIFRSK